MHFEHFCRTHKIEIALLIVFILLIFCLILKSKERFLADFLKNFKPNVRHGQVRSDVGQRNTMSAWYDLSKFGKSPDQYYENLTGIAPSKVPSANIPKPMSLDKTDIMDQKKKELQEVPVEFESTKIKAKPVASVDNFVPQYTTEDELTALIY